MSWQKQHHRFIYLGILQTYNGRHVHKIVKSTKPQGVLHLSRVPPLRSICALDVDFCRACTGASSAVDFYLTVKALCVPKVRLHRKIVSIQGAIWDRANDTTLKGLACTTACRTEQSTENEVYLGLYFRLEPTHCTVSQFKMLIRNRQHGGASQQFHSTEIPPPPFALIAINPIEPTCVTIAAVCCFHRASMMVDERACLYVKPERHFVKMTHRDKSSVYASHHRKGSLARLALFNWFRMY